MIRSLAVAACTLAVIGSAHLLHDVEWCPKQQAWARVHERHDPVIRDSGYLFARTGDAIYACVSPHRLVPITWHQDLDCYCAPASAGADAMSAWLGGECTVDQPAPTRGDASGACRHAHCGEHIGDGSRDK